MFPISTLLALLAMATGESSLARAAPDEEIRGPLKASLTASRPAGAGTEVVLRITLQNVSNHRQPFFLESHGAAFLVKDASGNIVHDSCSVAQLWTCGAAVEGRATIEPGAQMEFVDHWRPPGKCVEPGLYAVKAKLRAYQHKQPEGAVDVGSFVPFTLRTAVMMRPDDETGRCVASVEAASPAPRIEPGCPPGGGKLTPVLFGFNQAVLTSEARANLEEDARCIKLRGFERVVIEGNCDERGTVEKNTDLGLRRAEAAKKYLIDLGVDAMAIKTVSLSEERPVCTEETEDCWQKNRRADIVAE